MTVGLHDPNDAHVTTGDPMQHSAASGSTKADFDRLSPPSAVVRGESVFRRLDDAFAWIDGWFGRWLPSQFNPLAQSGAAANVALLVAAASGVLLLIWYSPSLQFAYPSLAAIHGRTLGGWVRALHRYSSDLTMLLLVVHAGRVFLARKFAGARWLAWVSGVGMLALVWFIGWTGYWLVWDQAAQQIAVSSIRLLDALPIFGEPLGRLFASDRTVPSLLFFVVFFLHMLLPLAIAVGLAVHLARINRAHLLPVRGLSLSLIAALGLAALIVPAPLDAAAQMAVKAESFGVDAWYLSPLALGLRFQHGGLWVALGGGMLLGALMPWLLGRRRQPEMFQALMDVSRCHACTQCVQDCPFDAIAMVARSDGKRFPSQAQVDPARCIGCGVCAGSCDSEGIGLPWFDTRVEEARMERVIATRVADTGTTWVALVAGEIGALPALTGYGVHRVPTASWVRPKFIERLFAAGVKGVLIIRDARAEAWARDGGDWVSARLAGERKPVLRTERTAGGTWCVADYDPSRPAALAHVAEEFRGGVVQRTTVRPFTIVVSSIAVATALMVCAVGPSHVRVINPAPAEPELALSFKAFGERAKPPARSDAAEAAKPVHMRGVVFEKPRRADVVVRVTIDGVVEERAFTAKGFSHDGPSIGEWRKPWNAGEHVVTIEILTGGANATARWHGTIRARERRLNVVTYDATAGFVVE